MQPIVHIIKVSDAFFKNYSYIIADRQTDNAIVIDPAWQPSKIEEIITQHQLNLKAILLTHSHIDHVNLVPLLVEKYETQVYMSEQESKYYSYSSPNLYTFAEDETLLIGTLTIKTLLTPGHTKGSTCYLVGKNLFSGDTLFTEGCGICFGEGADPQEMYESLKKLKTVLPGSTRIYPGHSFGLEIGMTMNYLLKNNLYLQIDDKEKFIRYRMRKSQKSIFNFS